jgi:hypothetical protein
MTRPKCKEIVYQITAQPEFNRMHIAAKNILKIEANGLPKLNQLEDENKKRL